MPSASIHKSQANHNYSFLKTIQDSEYRDWILVVAFYTALQVIDSDLTSKYPRWRLGLAGSMYQLRDSILAKYYSKDIYIHYSLLLQRSKEARYLEGIGEKVAIDFLTDDIVKNAIDKHLIPLLKFFRYSV